MKEIVSKLAEFGLDTKSSKIYLFLLKNKDIPVYKIAKGTQMPRTTVYKLLDKMESEGIVSMWNKNNVKHYFAENPEKLKKILDKKQEALGEIFGQLKNIFSLENDNPKTSVLMGKDGVKMTFENMLEKTCLEKIKTLYVFSEPQLTELMPKFFLNWRERKNKRTDAFTQLIVPQGVSQNQNYKSDNLRETREMPNDFPFNGSVNIIGDSVYFFSFKEDEVYSIIIESSIVAGMLTQMFQYIWKTLEISNHSS